MTVRKEDSGRRSIQVEVEVPGTPEQVWQAIATGEGISAWFVPTEIRDDGAMVMDFGPGMQSVARRTSHDPPHRFTGESEAFGPGSPKMATEWSVEAKDGGKCIVRVVHSLFAETDDWDDQLDGIESGWPAFFAVLRLYLEHFPGQPCTQLRVTGGSPGSLADVWKKLSQSLGLASAKADDEVTLTAPSGVKATGQVARRADNEHPGFVVVLKDPGPGILWVGAFQMGPAIYLSLTFYLYGDEAKTIVVTDEPKWQSWLNEVFPPMEHSGSC